MVEIFLVVTMGIGLPMGIGFHCTQLHRALIYITMYNKTIERSFYHVKKNIINSYFPVVETKTVMIVV